jgi:hypothetical protein
MEEIFEEDLIHARKVEYSTWSRRGFMDRVLEKLTIPIRHQL